MGPAELVKLEDITGEVGGGQWVPVMRLQRFPGMDGPIREFVPLRDSLFLRLLRIVLDRLRLRNCGRVGDVRAFRTGVLRGIRQLRWSAMSPAMHKTNDRAGWPPPMPATILLVEDEPTVREVTREALEMGGYRVLEACGPAEATQIADDPSAEIDLLLSDVVMPGMSGPELARRVLEARPGLVTLFMTGYADSEILQAARHGVSQKHIQKPFTVNGLLTQVATALASRWQAAPANRSPLSPSP